MLERDPATARELLLGMERTGRETLTDLDRVLATLRGDPAEAGPGPAPVSGSAGRRNVEPTNTATVKSDNIAPTVTLAMTGGSAKLLPAVAD